MAEFSAMRPSQVIRRSHPKSRVSTPFYAGEHASEIKMSLYCTMPGFSLLENNQKRFFRSSHGFMNDLRSPRGPGRILWSKL